MTETPDSHPRFSGEQPAYRPDPETRLRRITVVDALTTEQPPVDLQDLAARVTRQTRSDPPPDGTVERVAARLHHRDLPELDDAGVLEYSWPRNEVTQIDVDSGPDRP